MRVTLEHREETMGLTGRKECFIDCNVAFSEEEKAIIRTRDLYDQGFTVRTSTPVPTQTAVVSTGVLRLIGRILIVVGFIASFKTDYGFLFFIGVGFEIYGWLRTRREDKRLESNEQRITIKQLVNNPKFTV